MIPLVFPPAKDSPITTGGRGEASGFFGEAMRRIMTMIPFNNVKVKSYLAFHLQC